MKKKFCSMYWDIINSQDESKMKVLGHVMKQAMFKIIESSPSLAKEYLDELEAVNWINYLTAKEAQDILANMDPKPSWSFAKWKDEMGQHEFAVEVEEKYNEYALYITMCMILSDSSNTLLTLVPDQKKLFELIYHLALDKLNDKDGKFNIRKYFLE